MFANLGRKMDDLLGRAKEASEQPNVQETLNDLNRAKDKLEKDLNSFIKDDEKWQEVKGRLQNAAGELKKAFDLAFQNKNQTDPPPPADPAEPYETPEQRTIGTP